MNKITIGLFQFTNVESAGVFFLLMVISLIIAMCSNRTKLWQCALSGTIVYSILSFIFIAGSNHHPVKLWQFFAAMALISAHLVWFPVGIVALYCTRWRWRNLILIMAVAAAALFTVLGNAQEAANAQRKCDELERQNDFGCGLWQCILEIRDSRNEYAHSGVTISDRFPSASVAEDAIAKSREAIRDIYTKLGKQTTAWVKSNAKQTVSLSQRQKLVKWERGKYGLRNKVRSDCVRLCRRMETVPEDVIIRV
jgi:hypothetical protein